MKFDASYIRMHLSYRLRYGREDFARYGDDSTLKYGIICRCTECAAMAMHCGAISQNQFNKICDWVQSWQKKPN